MKSKILPFLERYRKAVSVVKKKENALHEANAAFLKARIVMIKAQGEYEEARMVAMKNG